MKAKARIYVIDDDDGVRDSLEIQLRSAGYEVKAFASAVEFLRHIRLLAPGCIIADVRMPEIDGLELQRRLGEMRLNFPIVMITGHGDIAIAVRAMQAGAVDFVEKPFSEETILQSIELAQNRLFRSSPAGGDAGAAVARLATLSPRERQVLDGLVIGLPNKTIAADLAISPRTVEIHRARVMDKMQARSLSELVRLALAAGVLIDP